MGASWGAVRPALEEALSLTRRISRVWSCVWWHVCAQPPLRMSTIINMGTAVAAGTSKSGQEFEAGTLPTTSKSVEDDMM